MLLRLALALVISLNAFPAQAQASKLTAVIEAIEQDDPDPAPESEAA